MLDSAEFRTGVLVGLLSAFVVYFAFQIVAVVIRPWAMAVASGVHIGIPHLIGMRLRGTPPELIAAAFIIDQKRGGSHSIISIETAYLAHPDPRRTASDLLEIADRAMQELHTPDRSNRS